MSAKKLNIGDYVRTKGGYIRKIENVDIEDGIPIYLDKPILEDDTKWRNCYQVMGCIQEEHIIKSSPNIIDLIEVGDYVNGRKVYQIGYNAYDNFALKMSESNYEDFIYQQDIKSIVTKEQFESIEYKC